MIFNSAFFILLFFPIVFTLNYLIKREYSNIVLLGASLFFYAWGEPIYILLMLASILSNWFVGIMMEKCEKGKKCFLGLGIIFDIGMLGYYKYSGLIVSIVNGIFHRDIFTSPETVLPIGISFFTFQAISYIVDVYRGEIRASSKLVNVALYISFFPQLIAGPIVKYKDINMQIEDRYISWKGTAAGFKRFIYGLAKKVLISNVLGLCVDTIYSYEIAVIDGKMAWVGALAYTLQIYYDFSGYSDMAIGLGKMLGFDIPENFNYPYLSKSITEFWRRWHISLGQWFREYVYIPLGGNRKGKYRTYVNLLIVFALTGLWHGADFSYLIWGLYYGIFSIVERLGVKKLLEKSKVLSMVYCFAIVNFGWVFFRSAKPSNALELISKMIMPWRFLDVNIPFRNYVNNRTIFIGICAFLGIGIIKVVIPRKVLEWWKDSWVEAVYCTLLFIMCLASITSNTYSPFIYFQF